MGERKRKSLRRLLTVQVSAVVAATLLAFLVLASHKEYLNLAEQRRNLVSSILASTARSLSDPLWDFNRGQVETVISSLRETIPEFQFAAVTDTTGEVFASVGERGREGTFTQFVRPIQHEAKTIGSLSLVLNDASVAQIVSKSTRDGLSGAFLGTALVALVVYLVLGWRLKPLGEFASLLREYSRGAQVNLPHDSAIESCQEMQTLVSGFTSMRAELDSLIEDLESKVRHRTHALELASNEARAAAKAKAEFLANMSHEIRTPLHGIMGTTELILEASLPESVRGYAETVRRSSELLLRIINDTLDFSKLEAGKLELHRIPFNPRDKLQNLKRLYGPQALRRNIELHVEALDSTPRIVISDDLRLTQVLSNLLSNALKFCHPGGVVLCVVRRSDTTSDTRLEFGVADTGIGIRPENIEKIFAPFSQEDSSTTRSYGGTGLGLSIARSLVRNLGGELRVISKVNVGTRFFFSIPLLKGADELSSDVAPSTTRVFEDRGERVGPPHEGARVLVVEDNEVNLMIARHMLERSGHAVCVAYNGEDALNLLSAPEAPHIDLILMDCQMPIMSGYEATRIIRKMEIEQGKLRIPIIAMTANASPEDKTRCLHEGMDDFLAKPFQSGELSEVLTRWIPFRRTLG